MSEITLHAGHRVVVDEGTFHDIATIVMLNGPTLTLPNTLAEIFPTAFMALGSLVNLRTLEIISPGKISCDLSAADLRILAKQWMWMESLQCQFGIYLGQKEVDVFAEVCP